MLADFINTGLLDGMRRRPNGKRRGKGTKKNAGGEKEEERRNKRRKCYCSFRHVELARHGECIPRVEALLSFASPAAADSLRMTFFPAIVMLSEDPFFDPPWSSIRRRRAESQ
jgi:hypothetical protein